MTRPARRTSALAGLTAAQPGAPAAPQKSWEDVPLPLETENPPITANTSNAVKAVNTAITGEDTAKTLTAKTTVTMDAELLDRARTAFIRDGFPRGIRTLSAWISEAIETKTIAVENRLNDGQPLNGTPAGVIPVGRRS